MVDWLAAVKVMLTGVISVFLVLAILSASVDIAGRIINSIVNKQKETA